MLRQFDDSKTHQAIDRCLGLSFQKWLVLLQRIVSPLHILLLEPRIPEPLHRNPVGSGILAFSKTALQEKTRDPRLFDHSRCSSAVRLTPEVFQLGMNLD